MVSSSIGEKPQVAPYSGDMLPSVARSAMVRWVRPGPKNSTNLPTTPRLRSISVTVSTRSVAVTPSLSLPASLKPITSGSTIDSGSRLDAADTPAEHRQAVDHSGVRIRADHGIGIGDIHGGGLAVDLHFVFSAPHHARQVLEIDLVADASAGRHYAEVIEGTLRPFQEFIALLILPVFLVDVFLERAIVAEEGHRHRMIDDEIDGHLRIDFLGVAAERFHGVAHGGQIDHRRYAGEILHQHARRAERELMLRRLGLEPFGKRFDVVLGHRAPVFVA